MKKIKAIAKCKFAPTHAKRVMDPTAKAETLVIWDVNGTECVEISGNTHGTREFTRISDLYTNEHGELRSLHAPIIVKAEEVPVLYINDVEKLFCRPDGGINRIYYKTAYDTTGTICGYIIPEWETDDAFFVSKRQYARCLKNRTIGGDAGVIFLTHKTPRIEGMDC